MKRQDDFKQTVKNKLAERAAYICSNPSCTRMTIGPDNTNQQKSIKTGIASHICAASPGGPRYDISQSPATRQSISNGIWLCGTCSMLIDKNKGLDYPADYLRKWKSDHEKLIKECLDSPKRVMLNFRSHEDQSQTCRKIVKFLENKGVLFMDVKYEVPIHVFDSVKEIRTFLTQIQSEVISDSPLEVIVDSINNACRHFMNTMHNNMTMPEIAFSLGAMRKIIGLNLLNMKKDYGVQLAGQINEILPTE
ncbi:MULTISPECIES: hypothetical protein [Emticicia]|uniref:hypothetical protein n=1 Tax=Emticicia TaxID=312278 RepID=UPI0007D8BBDD|nr:MULTISPECIES: hypothetical protein [Emticicia]